MSQCRDPRHGEGVVRTPDREDLKCGEMAPREEHCSAGES